MWMKEHPRRRMDGYFTVKGRPLTHREVTERVDYAIRKGYQTEADIPDEEVMKVLGWNDNEQQTTIQI